VIVFDAVRIGALDLAEAVEGYERLLGVARIALPGGINRFPLRRGAVELAPGPPGLQSLHFTGDAAALPSDLHGLDARVGAPCDLPPPDAPPVDVPEGIDHVVVRTPDADRAITLWRDRLGLRLALDRGFPGRDLRLLFFRSGGVTLEFASPLPPPAERSGPDRLWGVSYRVADLAACRGRLLAAGVAVSEERKGQKPGTVVATVSSHTAGVPTLLVGVMAS
jgi:catechol 2,3-dioxygenase-like lactoylglutathione lyase family enzyme